MIKLFFKTFLFSVVVAALSSCGQDENEPLNPMKGDLVVLKVNFGGIEELKPEGTTTRSGESGVQTFVEKLSDDLYMETKVVVDTTKITTRFSSSSGINTNSQVLVVVYEEDKQTLYKYQHISPANPNLYLPAGRAFSLLFYTYNTSEKPDVTSHMEGSVTADSNGGWLFAEGTKLTTMPQGKDVTVLWARVLNTGVITQHTLLPNVIFTPMYSRIQWELQAEKGNVTAITAPRFTPAFNEVTVQLGDLINATDKNNVWTPAFPIQKVDRPLTFPTMSGSTVISDRVTMWVDDSGTSQLIYDEIVIDGTSLPGKTVTLEKLNRGVSYRVISKLSSNSNIVIVKPNDQDKDFTENRQEETIIMGDIKIEQ